MTMKGLLALHGCYTGILIVLLYSNVDPAHNREYLGLLMLTFFGAVVCLWNIANYSPSKKWEA